MFRRLLSTIRIDSKVEKVKKIVFENRRASLRELARDFNICHESVRSILFDYLDM